jgi:hypothetical protein
MVSNWEMIGFFIGLIIAVFCIKVIVNLFFYNCVVGANYGEIVKCF